MKKIIMLLLSLALVISMFVACGKKDDAKDSSDAVAAKTGIGVVNSLAKSKAVGEADGVAEVNSTVAAVLVSEDGKILKVELDVAQTKINFSADGKLVTDVATIYQTKKELKDAYGMKKASGIGKEWNEQAEALEAYVVGKTISEVKGIARTEDGVPTDADLTASVTVKINDYVSAIEKAVANAQDLGAKSTDKLGLGITTNIAKSTDATAEKAGLAQAYSTYTVLTTDGSGKITSCVLDASQGNVEFDTAGAITTDLTVAPQTKQELKDGYGMKKASKIGKEWYEQANSFAAYVTGKTLDEVKGIALTEGAPSGADLTGSVTMHVTDFITIIDKAVASAQ